MHPAVAQSLFVKKRESLGPYFLFSLLIHSVFLTLTVAINFLQKPPPLDLDQKPIRATLVRKGKPRDEKLLPRKEELPAPPKQAEGVDTNAPKPAEKAAVGITDRPSSTQKQIGARNGTDSKKRLQDVLRKISSPAKNPELEGREDGDVNGNSATAEGDQYFGLLTSQIQRHYDVSQTIAEQERMHLRAQVLVLIGRSGNVIRSQLVKGSGNSLFDSAVLTAVKKASPFSPPPAHLRDSLQRAGVTLEFRP